VTLLGQGVGLGDPQRSFPTPTMLGFWDSVNQKKPDALQEREGKTNPDAREEC